MTCEEGEWWDSFELMWGQMFGDDRMFCHRCARKVAHDIDIPSECEDCEAKQ